MKLFLVAPESISLLHFSLLITFSEMLLELFQIFHLKLIKFHFQHKNSERCLQILSTNCYIVSLALSTALKTKEIWWKHIGTLDILTPNSFPLGQSRKCFQLCIENILIETIYFPTTQSLLIL